MRRLVFLVVLLGLLGAVGRAGAAGSVKLTWPPVVGADPPTTVHVERKASLCAGPASFAEITTVAGAVTTYTDPNLAGGAYAYRLAASNTAGKTPYSGCAEITVPIGLPGTPQAPTLQLVMSAIPALSAWLQPEARDVPWPQHSHYRQGWNGWLETVPATALRDGLGMQVRWARADAIAPELATLAASGLRRIRLETPWSALDFATNTLIGTARAQLLAALTEARARGLRPLLLLNANHGLPNPERHESRTVDGATAAGARTMRLTSVAGLVPGLSGLNHLTDFKTCEVLFTAVNASTRTVTLSKPLPVALAPGQTVEVGWFLAPPLMEPGTPQFESTVTAWLAYARSVMAVARAAGLTSWDIEVWNELTFGSDYLYHARYYDPPLMPEGDDIGPGSRGWRLLQRTRDMLAAEFPEATVINGYSNVTFFGVPVADLPPGTSGQSYHPYSFLHYTAIDDEQNGLAANLEGYAPPAPPYEVLMPEAAISWLKTESLTRHLRPITVDWQGRSVAPPGVPVFRHYMTEHGFNPQEYGVTDPAAAWRLKAVYLLRSAVAYLGRGLTGLYFFEDHGGDPLGYELLNPDDSATLPVQALGRLTALVAAAQPVTSPTPLAIEVAVEPDAAVFAGDATHPPLRLSEILGVFPFQLDAATYVVPVYVVTRSILQAFVPVTATVRLIGLDGRQAVVAATDPLDGAAVAVLVLERAVDRLTVQLPVTDSPRVLTIQV